MTAARGRRGSALVVAIWMLALVGAAAAGLAELARTGLVRARLGRDGVRAWFLAEGGLAETLAALPPAPDFSEALAAGPREPPGDGPPWTYGIQILEDPTAPPDDPPTRVLLRVTARGPAPVRRRLEAHLGRDDDPVFPGAASLRGGVGDLPQDFVLDGRDYRMGTGCMTDGVERARAGLALPEGAALPALPWPDRIVGTGGTPSIARVDVPTLASVADAPDTVPTSPDALATSLGTPATPRLVVVEGDAVVTDALAGAGMLLVRGRLRVEGTLVFTGVVGATGGVALAITGRLEVCGGLWADGEPALDARGSGSVRASAEALRLAAGVAPLPAEVRLLATRALH